MRDIATCTETSRNKYCWTRPRVKFHKNSLLLSVAAILCALPARATTISSTLSQWNLILSGNLSGITDIQGNTYVGGNVNLSNSADFGNSDSNTATPGNVSLAVGGSFTTGNPSHVDSGNAVIGGNLTGNINMNSGGTLSHGNPAALPASPVSTVASASQSWAATASNSASSVNGNQLTFNCVSTQPVAVFNISALQLFAQNQSIGLSLAAATQNVIINVTGASVTELSSNNFTSAFTSLGNEVIFNFYQATTISFQGSSIYGYVIAPNAAVTDSTPIIGGLMAASLNTTSEVELAGTPNYGNLTVPNGSGSPIPDAGSTFAFLGLAFPALALVRRKFAR
jgi:choice-of-anchor A domain-containing protein